jgi:hypothetical protein
MGIKTCILYLTAKLIRFIWDRHGEHMGDTRNTQFQLENIMEAHERQDERIVLT